MEWWVWMLLGLLMFVTELVTPGGFYFMFFGIGAVIVGTLAGLNAAGPLWLQFILFSALSVVSLWLFRGKLLQLTRGKPALDVDSMVGETAVASDDIGVNGFGKVEMRGTSWNARNVGDKPLRRSDRARVERVEGLTLLVFPEGN
jgi:membrane protein implicated in regulation of membrane protease activity